MTDEVMIGLLMALVVVLAWGLRRLLVVVTVEQFSMTPTFAPGDRVLALRRWPTRWLRRRQVVLIAPPDGQPRPTSEGGKLLIKRVTGLPGDEVKPPMGAAVHVPADHLYVQGDNTRASFDSRAWGPIPDHLFRGVVVMRLNPAREDSQAEVGRKFECYDQVGLTNGVLAPDLPLTDLNGQPTRLSSFRGQSVTLYFFLPSPKTIEPLLQLAPQSEATRPTSEELSSQLILVGATDNQAALAFLAQHPLPFPVFLSQQGAAALRDAYQIIGFPTYCQIDPQGHVQNMGFPIESNSAWQQTVAACGYVVQATTPATVADASEYFTDIQGQRHRVAELVELERVSMAALRAATGTAFDAAALTQSYHRQIRDGAEFVTVRRDDRLVACIGFMTAAVHQECVVTTLQTDPAYRQGSVLRDLLSQVSHRLQGIDPAVLRAGWLVGTVHPLNEASIQLHRKLGYKEERRNGLIIYRIRASDLAERLQRYARQTAISSQQSLPETM